MPRQKITKKMVVDAAFEIARKEGMDQVMVKNIAERLGCSVQPIYSYCKNMEELKREVTGRVEDFMKQFLAERIQPKDLFRSTGRAYVQLAGEEPHLFKIFILHERQEIDSLDALYRREAGAETAAFISEQLQISHEAAKELHLNLLIYTIGIGTIFCMTKPGISLDEIYKRQDMAYEAFLEQIKHRKEDPS